MDKINKIKIYDAANEEIDYITNMLIHFNNTKVKFKQEQPFLQINRCIKHENEIIGGVLAEMYWGILSIDILWVNEKYRNKGYATALIADVETIAKENNCKISHLYTYDFQAKELYEKLGYAVFGILEDCPECHKRYYMSKRFV